MAATKINGAQFNRLARTFLAMAVATKRARQVDRLLFGEHVEFDQVCYLRFTRVDEVLCLAVNAVPPARQELAAEQQETLRQLLERILGSMQEQGVEPKILVEGDPIPIQQPGETAAEIVTTIARKIVKFAGRGW